MVEPLALMETRIQDIPGGSGSGGGSGRTVLTEPSVPVGNEGYDNAHSDLILRCLDEIPINNVTYTVLGLLGRGTFGQVS